MGRRLRCAITNPVDLRWKRAATLQGRGVILCGAHLGGWEHLVDWQDSPGLWRDLAALRPRRLLLDEADGLSAT